MRVDVGSNMSHIQIFHLVKIVLIREDLTVYVALIGLIIKHIQYVPPVTNINIVLIIN